MVDSPSLGNLFLFLTPMAVSTSQKVTGSHHLPMEVDRIIYELHTDLVGNLIN